MATIGEYVINILDWVFESWIVPLFDFLSRGLELVLLKPLELIHLPVAAQIITVAALTALCSLEMRRLLKVEEKEQAFAAAFAAKKNKQKNLELLPDWKTRDVFYRATDNDLDEEFNSYLAQRFAWHGIIYLLPIFFALFWLDSIFPKQKLAANYGGPYVISLPANGFGIEGLPLTFVFLVAYLVVLILSFQIRKRLGRRTSAMTQ